MEDEQDMTKLSELADELEAQVRLMPRKLSDEEPEA
jgi:hypothetical protein